MLVSLQSSIIMFSSEEMLGGLISTFILICLVIIVIFYRKGLKSKQEYIEARDVVRSIVLSFQQRQDTQDKKITYVTSEMEDVHSTIDKLIGLNTRTEAKIRNLITNMKTAFTINKTGGRDGCTL